jgi:hypothetical protein
MPAEMIVRLAGAQSQLSLNFLWIKRDCLIEIGFRDIFLMPT